MIIKIKKRFLKKLEIQTLTFFYQKNHIILTNIKINYFLVVFKINQLREKKLLKLKIFYTVVV